MQKTVLANNEICKTPPSSFKKRKRGTYNAFDSERRAKIARYAVDNGVMNAARRFTVNESTVRNLKKQFLHMKKSDVIFVIKNICCYINCTYMSDEFILTTLFSIFSMIYIYIYGS